MSPDTIFSIANMAAMAGWLALAVLPGKRRVIDAVSLAIPLALAVTYTAVVATFWKGSQGGFSSLAEVALLFSNRWLLLAGWIHYLAFDLLTGVWELRDARARGIPHLLVVPCLALTFLFGPAGWLSYAVVSAFRRT